MYHLRYSVYLSSNMYNEDPHAILKVRVKEQEPKTRIMVGINELKYIPLLFIAFHHMNNFIFHSLYVINEFFTHNLSISN